MTLTHSSSRRPQGGTLLLFLAQAVMLLSGCAARSPFGQETGHVYAPPAPAEMNAALKDRQPTSVGRVTMRSETAPLTAAVAGYHAGDARAARPAVGPKTSGPTFATVAWNSEVSDDLQAGCPPGVTFCPAEERLDPSCCNRDMCDIYPDEYLADGGDRDLPVHYYGGSRQGLNTEDTIAEYSDHSGKRRVQKSNRVCVYSPRFGSVQVVEGAGTDVQIAGAIGRSDVTSVGINHVERSADTNIHNLPPGGFAARRRADGAEVSRAADQADQTTRLSESRRIRGGVQGVGLKSLATSEHLLSPVMQQQLANAVIWTRELYPMLSASTAQATQIRARFHAEAVIGIDDQAEDSKIHIVKLANCDSAVEGDIIHFTIRYFNTGDFDLHDVQIVDNLTPRLQFITDSAQTSRAGEVLTHANGEGSQVLTFVLDEPLPGRESGTIEFDVRVK